MQTGKSKQLNLKTQYWKKTATTLSPTCQGLEAKLSVLPNYQQVTPGSVPKLLADEWFLLTKSRGALEPSLWMWRSRWHQPCLLRVERRVTESSLFKQTTVPNTSQEHRAFVCSVLRGERFPAAQGTRRGNWIPETSSGSQDQAIVKRELKSELPNTVCSLCHVILLLVSHSLSGSWNRDYVSCFEGNTWSLISHRAFQIKYTLPHFFSLNSLQAFWYFNSWIVWGI